jgi:hypothetical protein
MAAKDLLDFINHPEISAEEVAKVFVPQNLPGLMGRLTRDEQMEVMIAKNVKIFGGINEYVADFLPSVTAGLARMPAGAAKENAKAGQRMMITKLLTKPDLTQKSQDALNNALTSTLAAAPAAGGKRGRKTRGRKTRRGGKAGRPDFFEPKPKTTRKRRV